MREFPDSTDVLFKGFGGGRHASSDAVVPF